MSRPTFEPLEPDEPPTTRRESPALPWLRLMRLPNVFTAIADIAMGFAVVHNWLLGWDQSSGLLLACLAAASALLYTAGMVLNDVYDLEIDAEERPTRPLPSGRIRLATASRLGYGLLLSGVALGWAAGYLFNAEVDETAVPWRSGAIATLLAACILLYNGLLKRTLLGPLGMGACRLLNVLLGMSVAATWPSGIVGYEVSQLMLAAGIGLYVTGITLFAKNEAGESSRLQLMFGLAVMIGGISLLGYALRTRHGLQMELHYLWILLGVLMFTIVRRAALAINEPTPERVQMTVKHSILSLIVFDAAICMAVAPPAYSIAVLALLAPALLLGSWVYST